MGRHHCVLPSKQATATSIPTAVTYSQTPTCSSGEPYAVEDSRDDVVCLGALPRRLDRGTDKTPTPNLTATNGRIHNPKGNEPTRLHRKLPGRRTKATRGLKGSGDTVVPASIRHQNIRIGRARNSNGQVFGFFDQTGYFRRRAEVDRSRGRTDPGPFIVLEPISHEQVSYSRPYQNMTSRQVRSEVLRRLMEGIIDSISQGEV
jgi:hypothetical protein